MRRYDLTTCAESSHPPPVVWNQDNIRSTTVVLEHRAVADRFALDDTLQTIPKRLQHGLFHLRGGLGGGQHFDQAIQSGLFARPPRNIEELTRKHRQLAR